MIHDIRPLLIRVALAVGIVVFVMSATLLAQQSGSWFLTALIAIGSSTVVTRELK